MSTPDSSWQSDDTRLGLVAHVSSAEDTIAATLAGEDTVRPLYPSGPLGIPDRVGRYLVLDQLGAGGMGVVFAAYDPDLDRKLALKLLHDDGQGDTRAQRTRLRLMREAQALARVSHPNVIQVYDVGTIGERVYIAMEFVEGMTLGEWLAAEPRSLRAITAVFAEAGRGLEAAHARGLVHRDFKPDNVLVTKTGHALVLDFGIAHAANEVDTGETERPAIEGEEAQPEVSALDTELTRAGTLLGTPAYMAPEQFEGGQTDARTDQFSFCVALWEAIHGQRPYRGDSPLAVWRALREADLSPPSSRRLPSSLQRALVRGLEIDPEHRFASLGPLLAELERDRAASRRRWSAGVVVAASFAFGLFGLLDSDTSELAPLCVGASEELAEVWDDERRVALSRAFLDSEVAVAKQALPVVVQRLDAYARDWTAMYTDSCEATHLRGEQSEALLDLRTACLVERRQELALTLEVFTDPDATVIENSYEVVAGLRPLSTCADVEALQAEVPPPEDPEQAALVEQLRGELTRARTQRDAGDPERATSIAREAAARAALTGYEPIHAAAAIELGLARVDAGQYEDAFDHLEDGFYLGLAVDQGAALDAALGLASLTSDKLQRLDEGRAWIRAARALLDRRGHEADSVERIELGSIEGSLLWRAGQLDEAQTQLEGVLTRALALGPEHERQAWNARSNLGSVLWSMGKAEAAADTFAELVAHKQRILGVDHPGVAAGLNNLGSAHYSLGRFDEARAELEQALKIYEAIYGPTHPEVARSLNNLAVVYAALDELELARDSHRRVLEIHEQNYGPDHPELATSMTNLAWVLGTLGEFEEAVELHRRAHVIALATHGPEHSAPFNSLEGLGWSLVGLGEVDLGLAKLAEVVEGRERSLGLDHPQTAEAIHRLAWEQAKLGNYDEAQAGLRQALAIRERVLPASHKDLAVSVANLGHVLVMLERHEEALSLLERFCAMEASEQVAAQLQARARLDLARVHAAEGRDEQARERAQEGLAELTNEEPGTNEALVTALRELVTNTNP